MTTTDKNAALSAALSLCRGRYQRAIVLGQQRISGADLRGTARHFAARYARSRRVLLSRMEDAGVPYHIEIRAHGLRVLVIGEERS